MNFSDLVGQNILIHTNITGLEKDTEGGSTTASELTGVESGGIWVHDPHLEPLLGALVGGPGKFRSNHRAESQIFLPFSSIVFVVARRPILNEKSLGIEETPE
jgi:hypothetical protein